MQNFEVVPSNLPTLTSEEFQTKLASWYEDKGILSQLRTQLRFKLINVLKDTAIGRDITRKTSQCSISLSKQAINLIVAEFLMRNRCDYTLSIFNTEAGLSSAYSDNLVNESRSMLQFDKENIVNILELIGIHKSSDLCVQILDIYYKKNDNISLLSCLINVLSKSLSDLNPEPCDLREVSHIDLACETDFIRQVGQTLMDSHMSPDKIVHLLEIIKCLHKNELNNLEENYNKALEQLKSALITKEKQMEHSIKKRNLTEVKLLKVIADYNGLKQHLKNVIKDRLVKEAELKCLKNNEIQINSEAVNLEPVKSVICDLAHCDTKCKDNNNVVFKLQNENSELNKLNLKQADMINELQKQYAELLHDFNFLQKKVNLLNIKVNEERPSHTNLNVTERDIRNIIKENRYKKIDIETSDSTTEEIIREAWNKIERLEKENIEIEELYKQDSFIK